MQNLNTTHREEIKEYSEGLNYLEAAQIMSEVLGRKSTYRNPNPLHFST